MQTPKKRGLSDRRIQGKESRIASNNALYVKLIESFVPSALGDSTLLKLLKKYVATDAYKRKTKLKLKKDIVKRIELFNKEHAEHYEMLFTSLDGMQYMLSDTGVRNLQELGIVVNSYKDEMVNDIIGVKEDDFPVGNTPPSETDLTNS